jgi:hypothetical protein
VLLVSPAINTESLYHWYAKVIGCTPNQVPVLQVNVDPEVAVPVIAGATVFNGVVGPL